MTPGGGRCSGEYQVRDLSPALVLTGKCSDGKTVQIVAPVPAICPGVSGSSPLRISPVRPMTTGRPGSPAKEVSGCGDGISELDVALLCRSPLRALDHVSGYLAPQRVRKILLSAWIRLR